MPTIDIAAVLAKIPELEEGRRFPGLDPGLAPALFDEVLGGGDGAVAALADRLREVDDGTDWKARFLVHALATHVSAPGREDDRKRLAALYAAQLGGTRPKPVQTFVLQQLQLIAGPDTLGAVAPLLLDPDPQLCDAAAATMVAVGGASLPHLRSALEGAPGDHQRAAIENALAQAGREV
jgi:hypothetical protein